MYITHLNYVQKYNYSIGNLCTCITSVSIGNTPSLYLVTTVYLMDKIQSHL